MQFDLSPFLPLFLIKKVQKIKANFPIPPFLLKENVEPKVQADFDAVTVSDGTFPLPKLALKKNSVEYFWPNNLSDDGDEPGWALYAVWVSLKVLKDF